MDKARRYNKGKNRYELISNEALNELSKVYTLGAHKYSDYKNKEGVILKGTDIDYNKIGEYELVFDASDNWKRGQSWKEVIGSVKRHIASWELGEDFDELGTKHLGNAMWGLATLVEYYTTHPELDDRDLWFKKPFKKVYLDIDGILANFELAFMKHFNLDVNIPVTDWNDYRFKDNFDVLLNQEEFWLNIKPLIKAEELIYPVSGYVTARIISEKVTHKWLALHGFPKAKLINVWDKKKSEVLKELKCDVFIDDHIEHFVDCHSNNILCYLMTASHNEKYNVGFYRCNTINEFFNKIIN